LHTDTSTTTSFKVFQGLAFGMLLRQMKPLELHYDFPLLWI
jgi:hypothetical protein